MPKGTQFWLEMLKIASVSGAPPQAPLRGLRRSPKPPSRDSWGVSCLRHSQLRAFDSRNFIFW